MRQELRIIGGDFRGKKINFLNREGLRPTPSRVRETLFNWLMTDIKGANCLDCYAGSGALGFEALSRGAKSVTFLEKNKCNYHELQKNSQSFNVPLAINIIHTDAIEFLKNSRKQFQIIFLDPPFSSNLIEKSLELIKKNQLLADEGKIYIESSDKIDNNNFKLIQHKKAGSVFYSLYC